MKSGIAIDHNPILNINWTLDTEKFVKKKHKCQSYFFIATKTPRHEERIVNLQSLNSEPVNGYFVSWCNNFRFRSCQAISRYLKWGFHNDCTCRLPKPES